jgi:hypothetical protein
MFKKKNFDGMRFGFYTVIRRDHKLNDGSYMFLCRCDCGNEFYVRQGNFKSTKSCGCMKLELNRKQATKHGGKYERLYKVWDGIKQRCYNTKCPEYDKYGGRGIKMCDEWRYDYSAFRKWALENGYDPNAKHMQCTIDRIDVNGKYEPCNCRWAPPDVQANNRRCNHRLTIDGKTKTVTEWSKISGVGSKTILYRLKNGWNEKDAVFTIPEVRHRREKNIKKSHYTPVYCYETKMAYKSVVEASEELGIGERGIFDALNGRCKHSHGYHFIRVKDMKFSEDEQIEGQISIFEYLEYAV